MPGCAMPTAQPRRHIGHHQPGRQMASGKPLPGRHRQPAHTAPARLRKHEAKLTGRSDIAAVAGRERAGPRDGRLAARSAAADTQVSNFAGWRAAHDPPYRDPDWALRVAVASGEVRRGWLPNRLPALRVPGFRSMCLPRRTLPWRGSKEGRASNHRSGIRHARRGCPSIS